MARLLLTVNSLTHLLVVEIGFEPREQILGVLCVANVEESNSTYVGRIRVIHQNEQLKQQTKLTSPLEEIVQFYTV